MAQWSKRSKRLLFIIAVFGLTAVGLSAWVAVKYTKDEEPAPPELPEKSRVELQKVDFQTTIKPDGSTTAKPIPEVCLTEACSRASAALLNAMDATVDPCDDFYQYACGNWNQDHIIPPDRVQLERPDVIKDDIKTKLKLLLENNDVFHSKAIRNTKVFYHSCMNESSIEANSLQELEGLMDHLGGWPLLDPYWNDTNYYVERRFVRYVQVGSNYIFKTIVQPDDNDTDHYILSVDQAELFMGSRDYYLNGRDDIHVKAYEEFAVKVAKKFGAIDPEAAISDVIDFEIQVANLTVPDSERRDANKLYNKVKISSIMDVTTGWCWICYLCDLPDDIADVLITPGRHVLIRQPEYNNSVIALMKNTSVEILTNYMMTRFVLEAIPFLSEEYRLLGQDYYRIMSGKQHEGERWKTCLSYTNALFPISVGRMFVDHYFDEEAKKNAENLIQNIKDSFSEILLDSSWIDEATKKRALEKEDISEHHFLRNVINKTKYDVKDNFKKIERWNHVDKKKWSDGAAQVNARYDPRENAIKILAGILQPPYYEKDYPRSLIYGGIGLIIGHEITHGFDDIGRQYDKDGNLRSWWTNSSSDNFNDLAQCIIDQYSNFTIGNDHIRGENTQGENIADNGGLNVAFGAYKELIKTNPEDFKHLPGLNLTHYQLFFLNVAQGFCGVQRPEALQDQILSDTHSPGKFRVMGTLSNSKDFSSAYQCTPGSRMNPEQKCRVW
ncbi:hypothetical protein LOTGIDRAFT_231908 [Lottia gigantea]|uniref:Endothelin-converting enzyme 1 n=1 Tax=Lottia gigantea TaxID=225164 RepID=V4AFL9_LOTGI|nr:hypothetical protein LOTGIDRAFT_231908 [Lottia gigantea]ESO95682.1 hypothetical protein LOTGIDRAFT_231908 [Lottia gigantea]